MDVIHLLLNYVLPFLVVLTVLVFVHELGHYAVARWNRVRIEVFSIGFGPELIGWNDRAGTRWKIGALPFGGYVRMFGEGDGSGEGGEEPFPPRGLTAAEQAVSFKHKTLGQRAAIVAAGPAANFLLAIVLLAGLFMTAGQPFSPAEVGSVLEDSAAAEAGFQPGDMMVRIDGDEVDRFEDVQAVVRNSAGTSLAITVLRDGAEVTLHAVPRTREMTDRFGNTYRLGMLGVSRESVVYRQLGPIDALVEATGETWTLTAMTFEAIGEFFMGLRPVDELGGPIKIAQMSGELWQIGIASLISFMALFSVNLGLLNLLPVPVLDGGHLLFYLYEGVRGRPLGEKAQEYGVRIGMILVLALMVFVTVNDFINLPGWKS